MWQWPYSAFGNNKPSGVLATTTENGQTSIKGTKPRVDFPLRDPGQYEDEETGMRHNMHRTYAQKLGRFPQPDPIGMAGGLNRFVYGENSPFMFTDPFGLDVYLCRQPAFGCCTRPKSIDLLPRLRTTIPNPPAAGLSC